eukprot:scaffold206764_cov19-Tisochrysis_lutea.AAC.2
MPPSSISGSRSGHKPRPTTELALALGLSCSMRVVPAPDTCSQEMAPTAGLHFLGGCRTQPNRACTRHLQPGNGTNSRFASAGGLQDKAKHLKCVRERVMPAPGHLQQQKTTPTVGLPVWGSKAKPKPEKVAASTFAMESGGALGNAQPNPVLPAQPTPAPFLPQQHNSRAGSAAGAAAAMQAQQHQHQQHNP